MDRILAEEPDLQRYRDAVASGASHEDLEEIKRKHREDAGFRKGGSYERFLPVEIPSKAAAIISFWFELSGDVGESEVPSVIAIDHLLDEREITEPSFRADIRRLMMTIAAAKAQGYEEEKTEYCKQDD